MENTCKNCSRYTPRIMWIGDGKKVEDMVFASGGVCELMSLVKDTNTMVIKDGTVFVGSDFGCIHFEQK